MIQISENIRNKLDSILLGILTCDVKIEISNPEFWKNIETDIILIKNTGLESISSLKTISTARKVYKNCGADPLRYRLAADSLMRRIIKGYELYRVNNVIDILNYISFTTGISIGGYDISKIEGSTTLDIGKKDEPYEGIGRGFVNISNLPVLRDSLGAFGTPTSDSLRTMVTDNTHHFMMVFFFIENQLNFHKTAEKTSALLHEYCYAENIQIKLQP